MRQNNEQSEEAEARAAFARGEIDGQQLMNILRYVAGRSKTVVRNVSKGSTVKKWRV